MLLKMDSFMDFPNQHLFVQSQQWKQHSNIWNLFKINNKNTRTTLEPSC